MFERACKCLKEHASLLLLYASFPHLRTWSTPTRVLFPRSRSEFVRGLLVIPWARLGKRKKYSRKFWREICLADFFMARGQVENTKIPVNTIILRGRVQRGSYRSGRRKAIVCGMLSFDKNNYQLNFNWVSWHRRAIYGCMKLAVHSHLSQEESYVCIVVLSRRQRVWDMPATISR